MQRLKVGDYVQVIAGRNKGKRGKVVRFLDGRTRVVVEGLNQVVRHQRPNQTNAEGGRITKEAPIHVSNVMPLAADGDKPTRVRIAVGEDGTKTRVAVSGAELLQR